MLTDAPAHFGRDLSQAWRTLRRSPGFTIAVVATVAIGIGTNAAVLGIIDTAFFRKIPVPAPERLLLVQCVTTNRTGVDAYRCSWPEWRDINAQRIDGLEGLSAYTMSYFPLGATSVAVLLPARRASQMQPSDRGYAVIRLDPRFSSLPRSTL